VYFSSSSGGIIGLGTELRSNILSKTYPYSKKTSSSKKHTLLSQNALLQLRLHPVWISRPAQLLGIDVISPENHELKKQSGGVYFNASFCLECTMTSG
jgi:hypothetical protein